ncbi:type II toxin-antitoxin system RelB/DinJ family antitoxin [Patescibacteria group bacterium]|nr:type II toxin-antitoxin system RelB/DinJ family antitoxin [Patescibacteria group bacterium]
MKTLINIKADKEVKDGAQKIAEELGLSLSAIINASLKQLIKNKGVCFSAVPRMTPYLENIIREAKKDYKASKNIVGPFATTKEMDKYLNSL